MMMMIELLPWENFINIFIQQQQQQQGHHRNNNRMADR